MKTMLLFVVKDRIRLLVQSSGALTATRGRSHEGVLVYFGGAEGETGVGR